MLPNHIRCYVHVLNGVSMDVVIKLQIEQVFIYKHNKFHINLQTFKLRIIRTSWMNVKIAMLSGVNNMECSLVSTIH